MDTPDRVWFGVKTGTLRQRYVRSDDVEYIRKDLHPVTVEMLELWLSTQNPYNHQTIDEIRAAIAKMKEPT